MSDERAFRAKLIGSFAAIYLVWGSTYLAIRIGVETLPPFLLAGTRFLAAGIPLYVALRLGGAPRPDRSHWLSAAIVGTLMLAGGNGLVTWAEQSAASSVAAVIIGTVPLWMTTLEAWPFRRARVGPRAIGGLLCGLTGVAILVAPARGEIANVALLPAAALLMAALSWSVGSLLSRSLASPTAPFLTAAMHMMGGGTMLMLWSALAGEWSALDPGAVSGRSIVALLYLTTLGSIVALSAYVWLMRVTSAAAVSTYAFVNPVVAVTLGWAVAGETVSWRTALATALIVGAVAFLQGSRLMRARKRQPREPALAADARRCRRELPLLHCLPVRNVSEPEARR
jgi:drug/metabolite transporter (DMT)-like permease